MFEEKWLLWSPLKLKSPYNMHVLHKLDYILTLYEFIKFKNILL